MSRFNELNRRDMLKGIGAVSISGTWGVLFDPCAVDDYVCTNALAHPGIGHGVGWCRADRHRALVLDPL